MTTKFLKPKTGVLVRYEQPHRGHVPPDGDELPLSVYYRRRIRDGDLVPARRPSPAARSAKARAKTKE